MKIVNRTTIPINVKGFEIDHLAVDNMRLHIASLPSLELLEQFERETEDGWYLYPKGATLRL